MQFHALPTVICILQVFTAVLEDLSHNGGGSFLTGHHAFLNHPHVLSCFVLTEFGLCSPDQMNDTDTIECDFVMVTRGGGGPNATELTMHR